MTEHVTYTCDFCGKELQKGWPLHVTFATDNARIAYNGELEFCDFNCLLNWLKKAKQ
jgi:hypothetical protein